MNELVFLQKDQALTTSLKVAEVFHKEHAKVIRSIENIIEEMALESETPKMAAREMFKKTTYTSEDNFKKYPMYLMNRKGFTLLVMGFTGKKARAFQVAYIEAFEAMEETLKKLLAEKMTPQWIQARANSKVDFKKMTTAIHDDIIPQMAAAGCSKDKQKFAYSNYTKMVQSSVGIETGTRDRQSSEKLTQLNMAQQIATAQIKMNTAAGIGYHDTYLKTKSALSEYAEVTARLMGAQNGALGENPVSELPL